MENLWRSVEEGGVLGTTVNCHHNYLAFEEHDGQSLIVTRKGAIRAGRDELGIIPGSMGTRSYIVRGLGNEASLQSASHGAGRRMSRAAAKRAFTVNDLIEQTSGVECRKDRGVIDEIPGAYKDIDEVMRNQSDLVSIEHTLKAIHVCKGVTSDRLSALRRILLRQIVPRKKASAVI